MESRNRTEKKHGSGVQRSVKILRLIEHAECACELRLGAKVRHLAQRNSKSEGGVQLVRWSVRSRTARTLLTACRTIMNRDYRLFKETFFLHYRTLQRYLSITVAVSQEQTQKSSSLYFPNPIFFQFLFYNRHYSFSFFLLTTHSALTFDDV